MKRALPLIFAISLACVSACGDSSSPENAPPSGEAVDARAEQPSAAVTTLGERSCPPESKLDYVSFGAGFFLSWCTGCHARSLPEGGRQKAPLTVNLDTADTRR